AGAPYRHARPTNTAPAHRGATNRNRIAANHSASRGNRSCSTTGTPHRYHRRQFANCADRWRWHFGRPRQRLLLREAFIPSEEVVVRPGGPTLTMDFDPSCHTADAIQRAAYRFTDRFALTLTSEPAVWHCVLHFKSQDVSIEE